MSSAIDAQPHVGCLDKAPAQHHTHHLRPPVGSPLVSEIEFANKKVGTILPSNRKKKTSTPTARGQPRGAEKRYPFGTAQ